MTPHPALDRPRSWLRDARNQLARRPPLVPPRRLAAEVGAGDFVATGEEFFALFRQAGLEPGCDVLDVGCGAGRMARPLSGWLRGRYEGFDVQRRPVRWCARAYANHPNFNFRHFDVVNDAYNPSGTTSAAALSFPYSPQSFDFAVLISVFTHLTEEAVVRYLEELALVLRARGRVFATWFLLDDESVRALDEGRAKLELPDRRAGHHLGEARLATSATPSAAVAYPSSAVRETYASKGLKIVEHWPGAWAGRTGTATWQDVLVAERA